MTQPKFLYTRMMEQIQHFIYLKNLLVVLVVKLKRNNLHLETKDTQVILGQTNVLEIISCTDSDGNTWREVPFLVRYSF